MKRLLGGIAAVLLLAVTALAAPAVPRDTPVFPKILTNARYVYVTSYDGGQFNLNTRPEDRQAINAVQDALQKSGKFVVVYHPREADIVLMVESYPSEDVLAAYDAREWPRSGAYLWRVMGRDGLQQNETPLVTQFLQAFDKAAK
jgi:hypothetical protein